MKRYAQVIVDLSAEQVDRLFTYSIPDGMDPEPGMQVVVPFGPRQIEGFVIDISQETDLDETRIKPIIRLVRDETVLLPELTELAKWMKKRYNCNLVDALRLMLPAEMRGNRVRAREVRRVEVLTRNEEAVEALKKRAPKQYACMQLLLERDGMKTGEIEERIEGASAAIASLEKKHFIRIVKVTESRKPSMDTSAYSGKDPVLTRAQQQAADELTAALHGGGGRFLLHGVTGSGKTEVYIRLIRAVLEAGKTAVVLVPEIALTPQMTGWFSARFGPDAAVLHSRLSAGERFDEWCRILRGEARVVIGARSAIFAPLRNVGAFIIDEEHETTYQSEKRPRYDAREIAEKRAVMNGAVVLLGSATPSIASYMRTMPGVRPENKLTLIELNQRVMGRPLPEVTVVDMRKELELGNRSIFSAKLQHEMSECLAANHQMILFLNRRGHSSFVSCRKCGYVAKCDDCDVSMTYHQTDDRLHCHYCGNIVEVPRICPKCGSKYIRYFGIGTQKVEEEVRKMFPGTAVSRMDVDTTQGKDAHLRILSDFRSGKTRILIGTQMIAKGLDFPNVTLVGVVAADLTLNMPDYRSAERTFQLLTQVEGRAGRAEDPGRVVVQTYEPEHYGIDLAAKQDFRAFYHLETKYRRQGLYPPFTVILRLVTYSRNAALSEAAAKELEAKVNDWIERNGYRAEVLVVKCNEAPIKLLRGEHRWHIFMKLFAKGPVDALSAYLEQLADEERDNVRVELEVNPVSMI